MTSNPPETLVLLATQIEGLLERHLGPECTYVLVIRNGESCNCISNAPVEKSEDMRAIFAELAQRNVNRLN